MSTIEIATFSINYYKKHIISYGIRFNCNKEMLPSSPPEIQ